MPLQAELFPEPRQFKTYDAKPVNAAKRVEPEAPFPYWPHQIRIHEDCQAMARHLFAKVENGDVAIRIDQRFALDDVRAAAQRIKLALIIRQEMPEAFMVVDQVRNNSVHICLLSSS